MTSQDVYVSDDLLHALANYREQIDELKQTVRRRDERIVDLEEERDRLLRMNHDQHMRAESKPAISDLLSTASMRPVPPLSLCDSTSPDVKRADKFAGRLCRFGTKCTRRGCKFGHPDGREIDEPVEPNVDLISEYLAYADVVETQFDCFSTPEQDS